MPTMEIVRIPVLSDNYVWLLHDPSSLETVAVDPAVDAPVLAVAHARRWRISQIWNTHWHPDHVGGNAGIVAATGAHVTAPFAEAAKIGHVDRAVAEGDVVQIGDHAAVVMDVPAHTAGHIAYHFAQDSLLFVGDTLFAMGCGRLFEGTAAQMFANMQRFAAMPDDTMVYCAHEYTLSNARFAVVSEPDNADIADRFRAVEAARARGEATVPTSIGIERRTNPFMRARDTAQLAERRKAKDAF